MLKKLGRDVAIYGSGDFALRLLGFLVFPVYAHVFSVEEFGVMALITTTTGVIALIASPGLTMAITRRYWDADVSDAIRPVIVSTGLVSLFAWSGAVVALAIAGLFPVRELLASRYGAGWSMVLIGLLTIVPELVMQYCLNVLRVRALPWQFTLASFFKNVLGVAVGLVLILLFHGGLEAFFIGAFVGALAGVPIALWLVRQELTPRFDVATAKQLLGFGYPFIFAGLAYWVFGAVDRWMLAELSDARQLGLYAIAYKFAGILLFVNAAFGQAWSPIALKLRREDCDYRAAYSRVLSTWFFVLSLCGAAIAFFGHEMLRLLTPREYWAAAPALALLVMGVVLSGTTQITGLGISLENRTRLFATAAWTTALANVALNFVLIPRWGALGASAATFLSYALLTSLYLFWSQRLHPVPLEKTRLLYSAALVLVATGVSLGPLSGDAWPVTTMFSKCVLLALMAAGGFALGLVNLAGVKTSYKAGSAHAE
jgi:O-antigen/teichoic acid export membrane protein